MTSLRKKETEVQKVQYDLSKVTQAVNDSHSEVSFYFITEFKDVQNMVSLSREKRQCCLFFLTQIVVTGHV